MEPKVPEDIYKTHLENKGKHLIQSALFLESPENKFKKIRETFHLYIFR